MWWVFKKLFPKSGHDPHIPRIDKSLANPLDASALDPDTQMILMSGRFRDKTQIDRAMKTLGATDALDLLRKLPPPPSVNWRARWRRILLALDGSYATDPHRQETIEFMRKAKRSRHYDGSHTRFNRRGSRAGAGKPASRSE